MEQIIRIHLLSELRYSFGYRLILCHAQTVQVSRSFLSELSVADGLVQLASISI